MKKILIIGIVIIVVLVAGGYYFYKQVIPKMAAKAIVKGEYSPFIPNKIQDKIEHVRDTLNNKMNAIIVVAGDEGITIEQLMAALDEVDKNEVINTYNEVIAQQTKDPEEVFEIAYSNIRIESFDPIILKKAFLKHVRKGHINRGLQIVEKHQLIKNLDMQMARSVGKQILLQKQLEIKNKVDVIE